MSSGGGDKSPGLECRADGASPFFGVIEFKEDGSFTGTTSDHYGDADIIGRLQNTILEFTKEYTRISPHVRTVGTGLRYFLKGSQIDGVHGGFVGLYQQDGEEEHTPAGQAACVIF